MFEGMPSYGHWMGERFVFFENFEIEDAFCCSECWDQARGDDLSIGAALAYAMTCHEAIMFESDFDFELYHTGYVPSEDIEPPEVKLYLCGEDEAVFLLSVKDADILDGLFDPEDN